MSKIAPETLSLAHARVGGQVSVAVRGLGLGVAEQLADHVQALAQAGGHGGEAVAQVVDAHVLQLGACGGSGATASAG